MASGFRRLAADHASLHSSGLPPNYFFPPSNGQSSFPDDLRQLTILLAGPPVTPYSQGLWRLHLRIPEDYPKSPPKAAFRTRIWHPNVEESTGAVCVDTLKRDWEPKLTLRDVLITISCLLIHPNPDSALNSAAGALLQDDYEAFARQAKLMTSIHAPVPPELKNLALEAKRRGEDPETNLDEIQNTKTSAPSQSRNRSSSSSVTMKKDVTSHNAPMPSSKLDIRLKRDSLQDQKLNGGREEDSDEGDDLGSASKENDPSLSLSPVTFPPPSPWKSVLGKRPLSALTPPEPDEMVVINDDEDGFNALSNSERNIAANINYSDRGQRQTLRRKSPKIADPRNSPIIPASPFQSTARLQPASETAHAKGRAEQQLSLSDAHPANNEISKPVIGNTSLKGNVIITNLAPRAQPPSATTAFMPQYSRSPLSGVGTISSKSRPSKPPPPATRKVSTNSVRPKPRTGLRRL
ncbi:ubiquitin conjugating enzyme E2 [Coccidioides immitis RS]|uniref:Ubiquitin conjugating enzyme E2 n=2 Tax=Coccidioides immitis TaxID=5501 RepID=A0A0E1RWA7_COCIM|nr:ubiquitin conjugating enzyme E2 [Coccidioides immitis RS]EAS31495.2 ubiquitin conjugating enzyme E2 [Coccidioides immitis RS]KMP04133.1 ubiquitin-conjugating enzyme E2 S [Coccidioides immitis RMSCC 2394]TPX24269.1 hypothetical protein DIZ76_013615 [Coccidioides immitis]